MSLESAFGALTSVVAVLAIVLGLLFGLGDSPGSSNANRESGSVEETLPTATAESLAPSPTTHDVSNEIPGGIDQTPVVEGIDDEGNKTETWIEGSKKYRRTYLPDGTIHTKDWDIPGFRPGAYLSVDEDGNEVETWVEGDKRYEITYYPDGRSVTSIEDAEPKGYTISWTSQGVKYVDEYDGYGNLINRTVTGTPTPTPTAMVAPSLAPGEIGPSDSDASTRNRYTPRELGEEVKRQLDEWNEFRVQQGKETGEWDNQYAREAQKWAEKLAELDNGTGKMYSRFPHERPYVLSEIDPEYNRTYVNLYGGENVWMTDAYNLSTSVRKFIDSPGHRRNLLRDPRGSKLKMGIGIAKGTGRDENGRIPYYVVYKMY
ncbi:CAP domain-containing protein [Corynebacterium sp. HMSC055D05]|uniref:CAP domain-containing protein n=1 Tax=Corynebacterium sp. HMSC055D05 TaxID=1715213 RepID=UPI0008A319DC|nr:CAP domain-containing protein [Corynebacterium sp. HMSC055D05]OFL90458.1 hypothetical protein HMPREF2734_03680 [Corynebacterium sp. HMSC055D05]